MSAARHPPCFVRVCAPLRFCTPRPGPPSTPLRSAGTRRRLRSGRRRARGRWRESAGTKKTRSGGASTKLARGATPPPPRLLSPQSAGRRASRAKGGACVAAGGGARDRPQTHLLLRESGAKVTLRLRFACHRLYLASARDTRRPPSGRHPKAMPRRGGGGGRSRSPPPRARSPAPPLAPRAPAPPPAQQRPSTGQGLGGMVASGMALGTGSAVAHRAVDAVLGSRHPPPADAVAAASAVADDDPCRKKALAFSQCMLDQSGDIESCAYWFSALPRVPLPGGHVCRGGDAVMVFLLPFSANHRSRSCSFFRTNTKMQKQKS